MRRTLLMVLLTVVSLQMQGATVYGLKTQGYHCPVGIDMDVPRFSWLLSSEGRGVMQQSYSIVVCADADLTKRVWESGEVTGCQSVDVEAKGFRPEPRTRYYWQVTVTDNHGETSTSKEKACFETGLMDEEAWTGSEWLRGTDGGKMLNPASCPMLRKTFSLKGKVAKARLYSTALGIYNVYMNGERVGITDENGQKVQDELKPGWTDYTKRVFYLTHDVTSLLQKGANAIGAELSSGWWSGDIARGRNGDHPQLGFRCILLVTYEDGTEERIHTDLSWKSSAGGPLRMGDIYHGETYDAQRETEWSSSGFDDSAWSTVALNTQFKGRIVAYEGPVVRTVKELERQVKSLCLYDGKDLPLTPSFQDGEVVLRAGQTLVLDFGQNASGWIRFMVKGTRGTQLTFRFGEMLNETGDASRGDDGPAGSVYTANLRSAKATLSYILAGKKAGEEFHPTTTFFGFRYVQVTATASVTFSLLTAETLTSVMEEAPVMATSQPDVNRLLSNIRWGQRSNFLSVPMDCPQRDERLGWTADTQVFSMTAMYSADLYNFYSKWLQDLLDSQQDDGAYQRLAPYTSGGNVGAAGWADAAIILPWNMYLMTGRKDAIGKMFSANERYMAWLAAQAADGYLYNGGGTAYADWLAFAETDKRYISVCYYAGDAQLMAKMAAVLSEAENDEYAQKATEYNTLYANIKKEYQKRYLNSITGVPIFDTQTAYLLALRFGLLRNASGVKRTIAALEKNFDAYGGKLSTGFLGTSVLQQTLSDNGLDSRAYSLLMQHECPSWLYSVDQGATTVWERWDSYAKADGFNPDGMNSFNHYAYGVVGEWMYAYMAGIMPDAGQPGFRHIILRPTMDTREGVDESQRINHAHATSYSPYGYVSSSWEREGNVTSYRFTIPANTTATIFLPMRDGDTVVEGSVLAEDAEGVEFVGTESGCNVYNVGSGTYHFTVGNIDPTSVQGSLEPSNVGMLRVTPNPTYDILHIYAPTQIDKLQLHGTDGSLLITKEYNTDSMDISRMQNGIYLLTAFSGNSKYTARVVKK